MLTFVDFLDQRGVHVIRDHEGLNLHLSLCLSRAMAKPILSLMRRSFCGACAGLRGMPYPDFVLAAFLYVAQHYSNSPHFSQRTLDLVLS